MRRGWVWAMAAAAAFCGLGGGGGAAALTLAPEGFGDARLEGGRIRTAGFEARALGPADVLPDWSGGPGGGALALVDLGAAPGDPFNGARGMALSTRDLAWPYGFALRFEAPTAAVSWIWAAGNRTWRVEGLGAGGETLAETLLAPDAAFGALALGPEGGAGIVELRFAALDGWDWILMDDVLAQPIGAWSGRGGDAAPAEGPALALVALPGEAAARAAPVPVPPAAALLAAGAAALAGVSRLALRRRRR